MKFKWKNMSILFAMICMMFCVQTANAQSFTQENGALKVQGTKLVSQKTGKEVQLRGISTHGINWDVGYPYVSKAAFQTLRDKYGVNAIRLAMYTTEYYGYCDKAGAPESQEQVQKTLQERIDTGVKAASELGMYVIIDWHVLNDQNPNKYKKQAKTFFKTMTNRYKNYDNVLYEICNEPNGDTSWSEIKKYAQDVIPVIRENDADAVVIVGTPVWSQNVDEAANSPLASSYGNVMYTLHFYSATHTTSSDIFQRRFKEAHEKGLPIMVTEFGVSEASGNGSMNTDEAEKWLKCLDNYGISYFAWSLSNKDETASLLKSSKTSGWTTSDLSPAGKWVLGRYKKKSGVSTSSNSTSSNSTSSNSTSSDSTSTVNNSSVGKVTKVVLKNKSGRKLKISFKKVSGATGYEIVYGKKKSLKGAKKIYTKKTSYTVKKCKKKKTYYVKVRAYKEVNGTTTYGSFSKKVRRKIKK